MKMLDDNVKDEILSLEHEGDAYLKDGPFHSCMDAMMSFNAAKQKLYDAMHDESIVDDIPYPHFKTSDASVKSWYDRLVSKIKLSSEKMRTAMHEA